MNKNGSGTEWIDDGQHQGQGLDPVDQGQEKASAIKDRVIECQGPGGHPWRGRPRPRGRAIKANPIKAVGLAFGVGYIGMRLFRR